jgi:hypothetical protein
MKKPLFATLALLIAATGFTASAAPADDDTLTASKTGKETFCRAKIKVRNERDQTIQLDKLRVLSAEDGKFFSEFPLGSSKYRPVAGAAVSTPMLDVMVPEGHKLKIEVTYRSQITAGKNPTFSQPKTEDAPPGAIQPGCSLAGQDLTIAVE